MDDAQTKRDENLEEGDEKVTLLGGKQRRDLMKRGYPSFLKHQDVAGALCKQLQANAHGRVVLQNLLMTWEAQLSASRSS